jgi:hypothetical protein
MHANWHPQSSRWDSYVERLRHSLPAVPVKGINAYVGVVPWVAMAMGLFGVLAFIALGEAKSLIMGQASLKDPLLGIGVPVAEIVGGLLMLRQRRVGWWIFAFAIATSLVSFIARIEFTLFVLWALVAYLHVEASPNYQ